MKSVNWADEAGFTYMDIAEYNVEAKKNHKEMRKLIPADGRVYSASEVGYKKPTVPIGEHPLWAFKCIPMLARDKQSKIGFLILSSVF